MTTRPAEASELARRATDDGARLVVGVGGDGTLHEIVNGLLAGRERSAQGLAVGLVPAGRGSDYARGLGLPNDPRTLVSGFSAWLGGDGSAADGELLGRAPCRFRMLPAALKFVC